MTPEEKARQIVADNFPTMWGSGLSRVVAEALREARNEALEEAASASISYAENRCGGWPGLDQDEICHAVAKDIETNIRALKDKP
jgi:hypothetical protein